MLITQLCRKNILNLIHSGNSDKLQKVGDDCSVFPVKITAKKEKAAKLNWIQKTYMIAA